MVEIVLSKIPSVVYFFAGYLMGALCARWLLGASYKHFTNEMHRQYLLLLERKGYKLNEKGKEMVQK